MSTDNAGKNDGGPKGLGGIGDLRRTAGNSMLSGSLSEMPEDECITLVLYPKISTPALKYSAAYVVDEDGSGNFTFNSIGSFENHHYFRLVAVRDSNIFMVQRKWGDVATGNALNGTTCTVDEDDLETADDLAPPTPGIG